MWIFGAKKWTADVQNRRIVARINRNLGHPIRVSRKMKSVGLRDRPRPRAQMLQGVGSFGVGTRLCTMTI
jgi:hypothetical protein